MAEKAKAVGVLTIRGASRMTKKGVKSVARWLRDRADDLETYNKDLNETFVARYYTN